MEHSWLEPFAGSSLPSPRSSSGPGGWSLGSRTWIRRVVRARVALSVAQDGLTLAIVSCPFPKLINQQSILHDIHKLPVRKQHLPVRALAQETQRLVQPHGWLIIAMNVDSYLVVAKLLKVVT
jgi:hypothetical protein